MRPIIWFASVVLLTGCATGKMGKIDQALDKGVLSKSTPIFVEQIATKNIEFTGDKAAEKVRTDEERKIIETTYANRIVEQLKKKGFNASLATAPVKSGVVLTGNVKKFEHGSAAARAFVGMGAGSSNIFTDFALEDRTAKKALAKFEVIATSGARGGFSAMGSFMDAHLNDGAAKAAEYIEKSL